MAEGLGGPVENPLKTALRDWVIGSEAFLRRMVAMADGQSDDAHRWSRRFGGVDVEQIIQVVATVHQVTPEEYVGFRSAAAPREVAALLCRRSQGVSLAALSSRFGRRHPDSSANLVRRAKKREATSAAYRRRIKQAESLLASKTENQV